MMFQKSFRTKIIVPTVIILVILVVTLNVFLSVRFQSLSDFLLNERLSSNINSLRNYLEECETNSKTAAVTMAFNYTAIKAIKERDTRQLLELFTPIHNLYRINFFTICDDKGIVLARTHEPEHFGDSILYQQNVRDALNGEVSTHFEEGSTVKVSVRTGAPIYDTDGALIGVVSTGTRFDTDSEIEKLKDILKAEVTVFLGNTRIATTIARGGQRITGTTLDPHIAEVVIKNGQEYSGDVNIFGIRYKTFYMPLFNAQNEVFATFFLGIPEADIISELNKTNRQGIIFGFIGLAISIALLFIIISSISKPITRLSDDMILLENGNLNIDINTKGEDEIGILGRSLRRVTDILRRLLDGINVMISEHSKGNTEYSLDTTEFSGAYKALAENILELVSISTNDQLTGLPNKRSFNNRLDWAWNRAKKDQTPISVLMLEVDDAENYIDTFGQQQGNAALQTIAKIIKQSKRPSDFSARWGSKKFSILLPATDSAGAVGIAERIRAVIENTVIPCADPQPGEKHEGSPPEDAAKVTVSIGVSTQMPMLPGNEVSNLVTIADVGLLKAKETGRNKVVAVM